MWRYKRYDNEEHIILLLYLAITFHVRMNGNKAHCFTMILSEHEILECY